MRTAALALFLLLAAASARADDAAPTIPDLVKKITDLRAQQAELKKQEDATTAALKAELKKQQDLLDQLGLNVNPPKPPVPPDPKPPVPPDPADPLRAKLKAAFDADPAQLDARRGHAKDLAALYRQAAKLAQDATVSSSGDLLAQVGKAAATMLNDPPPPGAKHLADVRKAVAAELAALLPTDDALTEAQRKSVGELFARLAAILESLGG